MYDVYLAESVFNIYIIISSRPKRNQSYTVLVQFINNRGIDRIVHEHANNIAVLCKRNGTFV